MRGFISVGFHDERWHEAFVCVWVWRSARFEDATMRE